MMTKSKNEIRALFEEHNRMVLKLDATHDKDMIDVIEHLETDAVAYERPDAYLLCRKFIYAIEHFCVSQYTKEKKSDLLMAAKGSQEHRNKLKSDRKFSLDPTLANLFDSLRNNLEKHSKSFTSYRENIMVKSEESREYRLIVLIEDVTDGYIVKERDVNPINPLNLSTVIEILLKYQDSVWGVIYVYGNDYNKGLTGCTIAELAERKNMGNFILAEDCAPFKTGRDIHVSKDDAKKDKDNVKIPLYDGFKIKESLSIRRC